MKILLLTVAVLVSQVYSAPQLITFGKEGKLGVNFGGYHAAVGGLAAGGAGGLFAEAGTPFGQAAKAGLGGAVDGEGQSAGGLYAGATAGGGVQASTGLSGGVTAEKSAGAGYASAQAGDHVASSGLGGETSLSGSSGFSFSGSKSFGLSSGVVKETEVIPLQHVEVVKPFKVHKQVVVETENEVQPEVIKTNVQVETQTQPPVTVIKEVYVPQPVVQKTFTHVRRIKPHHFHKHAYFGGYLGGYAPPPVPQQVVYKTVEVPVVAQKRVDVVSQADVDAGVGVQTGGVGGVGYTKSVTFQRNPTFFADIFNIPIQTLKAVGNFLGNAGGSTNISVQKSASVYADAESPKHAPSSSSSSITSTGTKITVDTSPVSKIVDDILAIPINTLGAVNKFLENNVPARKRVQVTEVQEAEGPTRVKLGPKARRRANRHPVVVVEEPVDPVGEKDH